MNAKLAYVDLKIRILNKDKQEEGYPVEITLNNEQQFPRGYLRADFLPWLASADPGQDGERLFKWLFADDRLKKAWAEVRGQGPQRLGAAGSPGQAQPSVARPAPGDLTYLKGYYEIDPSRPDEAAPEPGVEDK